MSKFEEQREKKKISNEEMPPKESRGSIGWFREYNEYKTLV